MSQVSEVQPITAKQYILDNWDKYNLVDSKEEFIALINILQARGENIDSLHDVCINGYREFCDIVGEFTDDRDVVRALYEFNMFYTEAEFIEWMLDRRDDFDSDEEWEEYLREEATKDEPDSVITKTDDGYVHTVWY